MQVNHLREGSRPHCARYSRDGLGRRQFRMETRENTSPGSSPLGYGVCSDCWGFCQKHQGSRAADGSGGVKDPASWELFFYPKAIVHL